MTRTRRAGPARRLAKSLLRRPLLERCQHTQGVANRAAQVALTVPSADRPVLIAAARPTDDRALPDRGSDRQHGADSPNALARVDRAPYLVAVADRVQKRLAIHVGDPQPDNRRKPR